MKLKDPGNPRAYYEEIAYDPEESREMVNQTGDPDAGDLVYRKRILLPSDGDTDAILENDDGTEFFVNFGDGQAYSAEGDLLPQELVRQAQELGLIPRGNAGDPDSLRELIANTEPLIGFAENVTLIEGEE